MITEVYINDSIIDIDEETAVAASYGNISFGEINKRKGVKSTVWGAPFSPRNKAVFESCETVGSYSLVPYRKASIRVDIYGVTVFEGFCYVEEAKENYQIQSFSGATDFYAIITAKKLIELDLSEFDHIWSEVVIGNSWTNTKGYIYAYVRYEKYTAQDFMAPDGFYPQVFFHTVIKQIAIDAGYELFGDVLTNPRFLNHIIICNKFPLAIQYGEEFQLSSTLPDLTQAKQWLDFANIYGLQFDIDNVNKIIRANYIDDLIFNEPENWTGKVDNSEKQRTKYTLDYFQRSYLRFNSDDICTQDYAKEILIDNDTLELQGDIYKSPYFLIQDLSDLPGVIADSTFTYSYKGDISFRGSWDSAFSYVSVNIVKQSVWWNGTYYQAIADSTNQQPPNATYWKVVQEKDIWNIKGRLMYGFLVTDPASTVRVLFSDGYNSVTRVVTSQQLDW